MTGRYGIYLLTESQSVQQSVFLLLVLSSLHRQS